ncbi:uncharacterized protein LOC111020397 [Momordica charantia]|uniref:Uncharacterized protein LOC111020397 n=1 Tax=Momordica charantia TaxID=3673 RepID=A0A6J1DH54_MOMCH|nr:uncharacterized protein LOC111020397 [Momordica charantia]
MDSKPQTVFAIEPTSDLSEAKNNTNGAGQIFKVAFFMLRRRQSKKSKVSVDMGPDKGMWRRLLGSMRPLHIHDNEESAPVATVESVTPSTKSKEDFEDALPMALPSPSPLSSSSPTSRSSSFNTSHYVSAANLQDLDDIGNDDNDDQRSTRDDGEGDEMIDAKAEEFIAQFYEQMRRQRYDIY